MDPRWNLSPRGMGMGKKCPPQPFVGISVGVFLRREDGDEKLKPDGELHVAIPNFYMFW
jgi:hypothetical protein